MCLGDIMDLQKLPKDILAQYPYCIELHAHSRPASSCSDVTAQELVDIYHEAGFDALVLTNHFTSSLLQRMEIDDYIDECECAREHARQYGMKVYLGAELRFTENSNDYLLYGVDRQVLQSAADYFEKGIEAYVREGKEERSVLVQAHPFRNHMELIDADLVDGFEVHNFHEGHNSRPATALRHAKECKANVLTAGTDFHHPDRQVPSVALRVRQLPKDSFELAQILKGKDYCFESAGYIILLP